MMRYRWVCFAVMGFVSFLVLGSCILMGPSFISNKGNITARKANFPDLAFDNLLWLPGRGLTASTHDTHQPSDRQVHFVFEGDPQLYPVPFQPDPDCKLWTRYLPVSTPPDGRIGVLKDCAKLPDDPRQDARYLMAYDYDSGELQQIVAGKLPRRALSKDFTWNRDMTRGVQELYDLLNGTLYWLTPLGSEPMSLTLSDEKRSWSLAEGFPDFPEDSTVMGIAAIPAWSPDEKTIAFWASFAAIGRRGFARADGEFHLIFLDPSSLSYTIVLDGIYHPGALEWSPNGEWLAFIGEASLFREAGLWLYSPSEEAITRVARGNFRDNPVWSPDSQTIAGILCYDNLCENQEIWEYDLRELTSK